MVQDQVDPGSWGSAPPTAPAAPLGRTPARGPHRACSARWGGGASSHRSSVDAAPARPCHLASVATGPAPLAGAGRSGTSVQAGRDYPPAPRCRHGDRTPAGAHASGRAVAGPAPQWCRPSDGRAHRRANPMRPLRARTPPPDPPAPARRRPSDPVRRIRLGHPTRRSVSTAPRSVAEWLPAEIRHRRPVAHAPGTTPRRSRRA